MTEQEYLKNLDERITELEKKQHENELNQKDDYHTLENLITKAVQNGNEPVMKVIKDHENRLVILEHSEATKALKKWETICKTVATIVITFILTLFLNNIRDTLQYQKYNEEHRTMEVQNEK
jgi:hypothetical protein